MDSRTFAFHGWLGNMRFVTVLRLTFLSPRSRSTRGFTLNEILVVVGILAVLLGVLIPVIAKVREAAMKVVCTGRLRELALATREYQIEYSVLPEAAALTLSSEPGAGWLAPTPQHIDTRLLRQLEKYLKYPRITPATAAADLPPFIQCPFTESEQSRGPFASLDPSVGYFYTGYAYIGRVEEVPQPTRRVASILGLGNLPPITLPPVSESSITIAGDLTILPPTTVTLGPLSIQAGTTIKKDRAATAKQSKRAVVWTDDVHWDGSANYWQYSHVKGRPKAGPKPLTRSNADGLAGQHRAYTDGTVEWVPREDMGLTEPMPPQSILDVNASFKIGSHMYWWF